MLGGDRDDVRGVKTTAEEGPDRPVRAQPRARRLVECRDERLDVLLGPRVPAVGDARLAPEGVHPRLAALGDERLAAGELVQPRVAARIRLLERAAEQPAHVLDVGLGGDPLGLQELQRHRSDGKQPAGGRVVEGPEADRVFRAEQAASLTVPDHDRPVAQQARGAVVAPARVGGQDVVGVGGGSRLSSVEREQPRQLIAIVEAPVPHEVVAPARVAQRQVLALSLRGRGAMGLAERDAAIEPQARIACAAMRDGLQLGARARLRHLPPLQRYNRKHVAPRGASSPGAGLFASWADAADPRESADGSTERSTSTAPSVSAPPNDGPVPYASSADDERHRRLRFRPLAAPQVCVAAACAGRPSRTIGSPRWPARSRPAFAPQARISPRARRPPASSAAAARRRRGGCAPVSYAAGRATVWR